MTPEAALAKQIEIYRSMTGQQRLEIALNLHELSCDVARAGIRQQFPDADADEVNRLLRERMMLEHRPTDVVGWSSSVAGRRHGYDRVG